MCRTHRDQDRVLERREIATLAKLELLLEVTGEIVMPRKLDRRTERRVSLHKNFARRFAATGPPRHLCEQLKGPFARAKIRQMQREIGIDDSDERDIRKVQTFRDHLGADQDVDLPGPKVPQCLSIGFFSRHRVCIHAAHNRFWENLSDGGLHFFRAEAGINERVFAAGRTFLRHSGGMPAQVTTQSSRDRGMPVKCERDAAIRAIAGFAAIAAKQRRGKTAPIQKQDCLLAFFQTIGNGGPQFSRENRDRFFPGGVPGEDRQCASAASDFRLLVE